MFLEWVICLCDDVNAFIIGRECYIDVSWCIETNSILRLYDFVSIKTHIEEDIYWWESKDVPSIWNFSMKKNRISYI